MKLKLPLLYCFILIAHCDHICAQIITTVAGNGSYGYSGDGRPATLAQISSVQGIALDNSGNLFIADEDNNVIRKVTPAGIISTFAGSGTLGYAGDGGAATAAWLYHPTKIAADNAGNIFFCDQNGSLIRMVNSAGIISTFAGSLAEGYAGDGGPVRAALFTGLSGLRFDRAGNLYISEGGNNVIRKVGTNGIISTIAGTGKAGFSGDGGPATAAQLNRPFEVGIDNAGNIFIPEEQNLRIRKIDPAGTISTFSGDGTAGYSGDGGPANLARYFFPRGLAIDQADNIYIADAGNAVIRKITPSGIVSTFAGTGTFGYSGDGGPAASARISLVHCVTTDRADAMPKMSYGSQ